MQTIGTTFGPSLELDWKTIAEDATDFGYRTEINQAGTELAAFVLSRLHSCERWYAGRWEEKPSMGGKYTKTLLGKICPLRQQRHDV